MGGLELGQAGAQFFFHWSCCSGVAAWR
jgi:hypothetical protein